MGKNRRRHRKEAHVKAPSSPDSDAAPASPVDHEFDSAASSGKIVTDAKVVNSWSSLPWQTANDATLPEPSTKDKKGGGKKGKKRRRPIPEAEPSELDEESHCEEENRGEWGEEGDRDEYIDSYNHYDDPHADPSDLWNPIESKHTIGKKGWAAGIEGADDPGIMLGLEVIDGSKYEVQKEETDGGVVTKVFFKDGDANDNNGEGASADDADADAAASSGNGDDNDEAEMARLKAEMRKLKRREARLRKKKRKLAKRNAADEKGEDTEDKNDKDEKVVAKRGKKAKKNNTDKKSSKGESSTKDDSRQDRPTPEDVSAVRSSWLSPTGVYLHSTLCSSLASRSFRTPTPIQGATLAASVLGRRDVVGAAPTGSGKTLAYGLPVLHGILEGRDNAEEARAEAELARAEKDEAAQDESSSESESEVKSKERPLAALILVPTRELALQVTSEIQIACDKSVDVCAVVGGMAEAKQSRLLRRRPEVVVATPGRLWELMSKEEHPHLTDLSSLRYLIIDEADRLIRQGSFPQLRKIFEAIRRANPPPPSREELERRMQEADEDESDDDEDRMRGLRGVMGEAKVDMLSLDVLEGIEKQRREGGDVAADAGGSDGNGGEEGVAPPEPQEMNDNDYERLRAQLEVGGGVTSDAESESDSEDEEEEERVHRQTFVYSATLTLPPSQHWSLKQKGKDAQQQDQPKTKKQKKKDKKRKKPVNTVEGAIAEMLELAGAMGQVKVVDLAHGSSSSADAKDANGKKGAKKTSKGDSSADAQQSPKLPPGLSLLEVKCAQRRKDSHLYAYLSTTAQGSSGPSLVFCNSVACVRRVGETLRMLGVPVKTIHAKMAQKARLSALDSVKNTDSKSSSQRRAPVVVATDVAARGLDLPDVSTVIHYDVARAVDTFVHRAGRTARGVGEKAVGTSVSLVSPAEETSHRKICASVIGARNLKEAPLDGRLLSEAQARVALASRIVAADDVQSKASKENAWFAAAAEGAGLDLDEDLLDEGLAGGDRRDRHKLIEAGKARAELRELLAKPMRKQNFGKFLSGVGAAEAVRAESEVAPYAFKLSNDSTAGRTSKKKRRKKR